jgi:hypothetical protein
MNALTAAVCAATLAGSSLNCVAQQPKKTKAILPDNCHLQLDDGAIYFTELEVADGCLIYFGPTVTHADVVVDKLTLHGKSTIDLSPRPYWVANAPGKPPTPPQAGNTPPTQRGQDGAPGGNGLPGISGTALKLTVHSPVADDGSLWIQTDGFRAAPGGSGGDGAKGAGPNTSGFKCYDGGAGGNGGHGGNGGTGGDTAQVLLTIGPRAVAANRTDGVAPSARPAAADLPGAVVIAGSPGAGGGPGDGGSGGPGGEGRKCGPPATEAKPGPNGHSGPPGTPGQPGNFAQ